MSLLHFVSILLEFVVFVLALKMVFEKKRYIGVAWAVTFGIYVFYDLAKGQGWGLPREFLDTIFLIATLSALFAIWHLGRKKA
jgi:lipoprotein signal peptidase